MNKISNEVWDSDFVVVRVPKSIKGKLECMKWASNKLKEQKMKVVIIHKDYGNTLYFSVVEIKGE